LKDRGGPADRPRETRMLVLTAFFAALTGVGAFLALPVEPVPFTLQTFFVLMAGVVLGPRYGAASQGVYALLGLVAPVYAGGASGPGILFGPRGGYIFGFIAAALVVGFLSRGSTGSLLGHIRVTAAMLAGVLVIYGGGMVTLSLVLGMDWRQAFLAGVLPFLPLDVLKALLAAPLALRVKKHLDI
jgi:biotin transport system substrate-specific component